MDLTLQHIGKIEAVGTVQVFGYSAQRIDAYGENPIYINFAELPNQPPMAVLSRGCHRSRASSQKG